MIAVLVKALSKPFYQAHAGFFFVLIFFGLGFLRGNDHKAIAQYIANSDAMTGFLLLLFLAYQIQVVFFIKSLLRKAEFRFIRDLALIRPIRQVFLLAFPYISLNSIVILYSCFVGTHMLDSSTYQRLIAVAGYVLFSILICSWLTVKQLKSTTYEYQISFIVRFFHTQFRKPVALWYPIHLLKSRPIMYSLTKALSISLFIGFFTIYELQRYDWRFLAVGTILAMGANLILAHEYFEFQIKQLAYFRNMPMTIGKRLSGYLVTVGILLIPEVIIVIRRIPVA